MFLFVTTGTDRLQLDRMVGWVDDWLEERSDEIRCLVQRGPSGRPANAVSEPYLSFDRFLAELESADIVVSHAGTGSIMMCRKLGMVPIVVPRRQRFGEAVDDHQVAFARRMAREGEVILAESRDALVDALDRVVADPDTVRRPPPQERLADAIHRFEAIVDLLVYDRRRSRER